MKKLYYIFIILLFSFCKEERFVNDCFRDITFNEIIHLNNPEFQRFETPNESNITTDLGGRKILIIKRLNKFKAFDLQSPKRDCTTPMSFDGIKIKCSCSKKEYNYLNGSPIDGKGCFLLEYFATQNNNLLQITRK